MSCIHAVLPKLKRIHKFKVKGRADVERRVEAILAVMLESGSTEL